MSIFIDTNILVYAINKDSPYHIVGRGILDDANNGNLHAFVSPQVLSELYATLTNTSRIENPLTPEDAYDVVKRLLDSEIIGKIFPQETTLGKALLLAKENNIRAQEFFDVLIVATMLDNDIDTIYTANEDDFSKYNEINVYNPFRKK